MITFNIKRLSFVYHLDVILQCMVLTEHFSTFIAHEASFVFRLLVAGVKENRMR